jgi:hypothetical protein
MTDQIFYIRQILDINGSKMVQYISFHNFMKAYNSVKREVIYVILIEFAIPRKLVEPIKMFLNETYSTVRIGKYQSDKFPIQNGLKQGKFFTTAFQLCLGIRHEEGPREPGRAEIERYTPAFGL